MRVVIADDSGLLRDGLSRLLAETGTEVVAAVGDAIDLIATVDEHRPDLAVIDIRMPPTYTHEGARAAVDLRERHPELGILLLSQSLESRYVADLVRAHPQRFGYLLKDRVVDVDVLVQAMHTVLAGGTVLDPAVVSHLMGNAGLAYDLERLSTREREVLELMAQGRSNAAIAADLVIDLRTVESHIARILTKLDLHPTADEHRRGPRRTGLAAHLTRHARLTSAVGPDAGSWLRPRDVARMPNPPSRRSLTPGWDHAIPGFTLPSSQALLKMAASWPSISSTVTSRSRWSNAHRWPDGSRTSPVRTPQNASCTGECTVAPAETARSMAASASGTVNR